MKIDQYIAMVKRGVERRAKIILARGSNYDRGMEDTLSSFKAIAKIANALEVAGSTSFKGSDVAAIMVILKLVRDSNIKRNKRGIFDKDRMDTHDDMINYLELKFANEIDEEET